MILFDQFFPFDDVLARPDARPFVPAADVTVSERDVVLTLDLPGLTAEDLDIQVLDNHLVVRGERRRPQPGEGTTWTHSERAWGAFERRVRLPQGVDPDSITASMDNGVLSLIVPKPDRLRPRTIAIGGSDKRELAETT